MHDALINKKAVNELLLSSYVSAFDIESLKHVHNTFGSRWGKTTFEGALWEGKNITAEYLGCSNKKYQQQNLFF